MDCITAWAGLGCGPALYLWQYTEDEMHPPGQPVGKREWIPLCAECAAYWRTENAGPTARPYRIRSVELTSA